MTATSAQVMRRLGIQGVSTRSEAMHALRDVGPAGTYTIGANREVHYDKPLTFTADNINDYDF